MIVKKKINKNIENTHIRKLSIQFSLDGFSFCIRNQFDQTHTLYNYLFDFKIENPVHLLEKITNVFKTEDLLQQDFSSVFVIHQNNLATLVPTVMFEEENIKEYLKFSVKTFPTDFIASDSLKNMPAKNVYVPYVNINNYIFQHFGTFEYKHHTSIFIDKLLAYNQTTDQKMMYVNVSKGNFDLVVLEKQTLILSNSFTFETSEDFIYYILFTAEQLHLDPESFPLIFSGAIEENTKLYKIAYTYIRNIHFIKNKAAFFTQQTGISNHHHFTLID